MNELREFRQRVFVEFLIMLAFVGSLLGTLLYLFLRGRWCWARWSAGQYLQEDSDSENAEEVDEEEYAARATPLAATGAGLFNGSSSACFVFLSVLSLSL